MRRILLLVTVASRLAAAMALSGVAQARPIAGSADAQCAKLAIKTLGPSFNPSNYTFVGGSEGDDDFSLKPTDSPQVFCGFGGDDLTTAVDDGDIFLGGAGNDWVFFIFNGGTFYGQEGDDLVIENRPGGTFYGGPGDDVVVDNQGTFVQ
jgi:hypothetical protein